MMRKILRFRKLIFIVSIFTIFSVGFLISVEKFHTGFPSLPQQRRIQAIFKSKNRPVGSHSSTSIHHLKSLRDDLITDVALREDIKKATLDHRLTYAENFSLPILVLPDNKQERLAYGLNQDDKEYLNSLRRKGQIEPLPSGGERIRATPRSVVRFPSVLKSNRPAEWKHLYHIYLNLTFYPWWEKFDLRECRNFSITFAPPGSLSPKAFASFPASGNSWVRQLIESSSGIFTGSMYEDKTLIRNGMYGEGVTFDSGMTIVQKTHGYTTGKNMLLPHSERITKNHMNELNNEAILVIRNPFKALISHRHLDVGGHIGYAPKSHFVGLGWKDFVLLKIKLWKEFYTDWIENSRPRDLCIVFYEELLTDVMPVIRRTLKFLSLPVDNQRLECVLKYSRAELKRKELAPYSLPTDPFTEDLKLEVFKAIDELDKILTARVNISLPLTYYKRSFNPELRSLR